MHNESFTTPTQALQFYDKYSRWNNETKRRETWEETVDRVMTFFKAKTPAGVLDDYSDTDISWSDLRTAMLAMEAMPSMRVVQMAGPSLERCNVGAYNCAYLPLDSIGAFGELLYILMQGTGCGFSAEHRYVDRLPYVNEQATDDKEELYWQVADTTEGWCDALSFGMKQWFGGHDVTFDFSAIRPQGAVLHTKGGRASGPDPLKNLLSFARKRILSRQGSYLTTLDAHDLACMCGSIVQVGGVRRAAEISLSDLGDDDLKYAKFGDFAQHPERHMANNSAVYEEKPTLRKFMKEWLNLAMSGTGERGIFNRKGAKTQMPKRRKKNHKFGLNPCGEIILRPRQFCNLSIAIAREGDTVATLEQKVRIAAVFGTIQSLLTDFSYLPEEWQKNCEEERLLGVDITGQMDCPLLRPEAGEKRNTLLHFLRSLAVTTNKEYAAKLGIPQATAVTCVKPSGNSAQLFDCSSGIHPRFAPYYIRRFRIGAYTPVGKFLVAEGFPHQIPHQEDQKNPAVLVFEFPMKSPDGAVTRKDMTAIDQLENWRVWKQFYTEHNPSCTIYIDDDVEWLKAGSWVFENWDTVGGIAFLPRDGGNYLLPPYEEINKETYDRLSRSLPGLDFSGLHRCNDRSCSLRLMRLT